MPTKMPLDKAEIRALLEMSVTLWKKSIHRFSWPDDGVSNLAWAYDFHMAWVKAWNEEDRRTPADEFMMRYFESH